MGKIIEVLGPDNKARTYIQTQCNGVTLYIDTAHLETAVWKNTAYVAIYRYQELLRILELADVDDIVLDNLYNISDKPKLAQTFLNIAQIMAKKDCRLWILNQFIYDIKGTQKYKPWAEYYFKKYNAERILV